jgi:hypothetical protein
MTVGMAQSYVTEIRKANDKALSSASPRLRLATHSLEPVARRQAGAEFTGATLMAVYPPVALRQIRVTPPSINTSHTACMTR